MRYIATTFDKAVCYILAYECPQVFLSIYSKDKMRRERRGVSSRRDKLGSTSKRKFSFSHNQMILPHNKRKHDCDEQKNSVLYKRNRLHQIHSLAGRNSERHPSGNFISRNASNRVKSSKQIEAQARLSILILVRLIQHKADKNLDLCKIVRLVGMFLPTVTKSESLFSSFSLIPTFFLHWLHFLRKN